MNAPTTRTRQWRDVDMDFGLSPRTKDVAARVDVDAIKQQIRYLLSYERYDDPFHPEVSVGLNQSLFDNWSDFVRRVTVRKIEDAIKQWVTRVDLVDVSVRMDDAQNQLYVTVDFKIKGIPETVTYTSVIKRLR